MTRFEAFKTALEALCVEHGVQLGATLDGRLTADILFGCKLPINAEIVDALDPDVSGLRHKVEYCGVSRGLTQTEQIPIRLTRPDKFGKPSPNNGV